MPIVPMNIADSNIPYVEHNEFSRHNETEKQNTDSSQYGFEEHKKDPSQICGEKH